MLLLAACTPDVVPPSTEGPTVRVPAEWEPQDAVWLQWPQRWESDYEPTFAKIVAAILHHEDVHVLVAEDRTRTAAEAALQTAGVSEAVIAGDPSAEGFQLMWHAVANDNAWMRDNGPRYVLVDGELRIQDWGFDAWGGAFGPEVGYAADDVVPTVVGELLDLPVDTVELVHERGDLEFNGTDTVVLNWSVIGDPERNPGLTQEAATAELKARFGVTRVVYLEGTPTGDLTGGHVDGLARFIDADRIVVADCSDASACQPGDVDDQLYDAAADTLAAAGLEVIRWPFRSSVVYRGVAFDTDYMNWLVGNGFVITVGFDDPEADEAARTQLQAWFPGREVYIVEALASWYAGGGVHCHTNDQPSG